MLEELTPLYHWDRETPSRGGMLRAMSDAMALLGEALPLALDAVSRQDRQTQFDFWSTLGHFDGTHMDGEGACSVNDVELVRMAFSNAAGLLLDLAIAEEEGPCSTG